jgi:gliding motility-associated-like protein
MRLKLTYIAFLFLAFIANKSFAQAPKISYSSPQVYTAGTAISPLAPANSGGGVPNPNPYTIASGFSNLLGVTIDAAYNLYAVDNGNNDVHEVPSNTGSPLILGSGFNHPTGVAVDAAGNVYVADNGNNAIKKIPIGGGPIVTLGSGFNGPYGIALDAAGNLYVGDANNNAVKKIPAGSNTPVSIGTGFNHPTGVAVDAAGNVYVADRANNAIKKILANGGSTVTLASGNGNPNGVAVDATGNVYFADTHNTSIVGILIGGGTVAVGSGFTLPTAVAVDGGNTMYVANNGAGSVQVMSIFGGYVIDKKLPAGLTFNNTTGVISGTPSTSSPSTNYTVTATNGSGSGAATLNITVILPPKPKISYSTPQVYTMTVPITPLSPVNTGGAIPATGGYAISPALPAGLIFNKNTGTISGTPTAASPATNYTVIAANPGGSTTAIVNITVNLPPKPIISYTSPHAFSIFTQISPLIPVNTGGAIYTNSGYAVDPALPAGLNFNNNSGVISGTPTAVSPPTNYTVTASNAGGSASTTVNISVFTPGVTFTNLAISSGTLAPAFAPATTAYTASVPYATSSITVTPTTSDPGATVTVNGAAVAQGSSSGAIALNQGLNTITTVVTAPDGITTKTYTIKITRGAPSTNALIASISLNPVSTLVGSTGPGYLNFTSAVLNTTTSVQVIPTAKDPNATITVNGKAVLSGSASASIPLAVGSNTITTIITAEDKVTTKTIIITVTRALSADAGLVKLMPGTGSLTPAFATATTSYTESVANTTTSIVFIPTTNNTAATVTVNGAAVRSGTGSASIPLAVGANTIKAIVTAQDGKTIKSYTVTVTRLASSNALLASVSLNPVSTLVGTTGTGYLNFTSSVSNSETSVQVIPTVKDPTATITVNGKAVASGAASTSLLLAVGANTITIVITAQDKTTTKTIIITVNRSAAPGIADLYQTASVTKPTDNVAIENDGISVHQGVSPNGDGVNDYLTIDNIANYPDNRLMIVDKNGLMIYQTKGYDNSSKLFDGHSNINGKMQLPGTYFYSLDYTVNGENKHKTGYIILKY